MHCHRRRDTGFAYHPKRLRVSPTGSADLGGDDGMKRSSRSSGIHMRDQLIELVQLDANATCLYRHVLPRINEQAMKLAFERFLAEHALRLVELPYAIQHFGWATPEFRASMKGRAESRVASFRCGSDLHGALKAVRRAERLHAKRYGEASSWDLDDSRLAALLQAYEAQERDHLSFIEGRILQLY